MMAGKLSHCKLTTHTCPREALVSFLILTVIPHGIVNVQCLVWFLEVILTCIFTKYCQPTCRMEALHKVQLFSTFLCSYWLVG